MRLRRPIQFACVLQDGALSTGSFLPLFEGPVLQGTLIKAEAILSFGALLFFTVLQNACG